MKLSPGFIATRLEFAGWSCCCRHYLSRYLGREQVYLFTCIDGVVAGIWAVQHATSSTRSVTAAQSGQQSGQFTQTESGPPPSAR